MTFRGMEGVRVHALQIYLGLSAKNRDIAQEWIAAISGNEAALYNFVERHSFPEVAEPTEGEMERLEAEIERAFAKEKRC